MPLASLIFILLALVSEFLGTVGGFGSSVFMIPLAQLLLGLQVVLALTALLHVFGNGSRVFLFWRDTAWRTTLWFAVPSILCTVAGAWLTDQLDTRVLEAAMGGIVAAIAILFLFKPEFRLPGTPRWAVGTGAVSGLLTGLVGTGGAIRAAGLAGFGLGKNAFIATNAAIDLGNDLSRSVVYLYKGYLPREYWLLVPLLLAAAWLGSWLGKKVTDRMPQERFRVVVLVLILGIGLFTLGRGIYGLSA